MVAVLYPTRSLGPRENRSHYGSDVWNLELLDGADSLCSLGDDGSMDEDGMTFGELRARMQSPTKVTPKVRLASGPGRGQRGT